MTATAFCPGCGTALPAPPPVTCARCGRGVYADARPCAGALVTRAGCLLLVRRAHQPWRLDWDVPGGHCLRGEHPEETAARETLEETGLRVRVGPLLGLWLEPGDPADASDAGTLNVYYLAEPAEDEPSGEPDPAETLEIRWFAADRLPPEIAFPAHLPDVLRAWRGAPAAR